MNMTDHVAFVRTAAETLLMGVSSLLAGARSAKEILLRKGSA